MTGTALAAGGIATMAFALPGLGFALGPIFEDTTPTVWQDVGPEDDFNEDTYVPRVINITPEIGDAGKTTIYVRTFNPRRDKVIEGQDPQPYVDPVETPPGNPQEDRPMHDPTVPGKDKPRM